MKLIILKAQRYSNSYGVYSLLEVDSYSSLNEVLICISKNIRILPSRADLELICLYENRNLFIIVCEKEMLYPFYVTKIRTSINALLCDPWVWLAGVLELAKSNYRFIIIRAQNVHNGSCVIDNEYTSKG